MGTVRRHTTKDAMTDECGIYERPRTIQIQHAGGIVRDDSTNSDNVLAQRHTSFNIRHSTTDCPRSSITTDRASLGIISSKGPANPNFVTEHSRLKSFSCWPPALPHRPQELVEAGFLYTGRSDQVKCFYCDGGLESWEPTDCPWREHQKWFPDCAFVQMRNNTEEIVKRRSIQENEILKEIDVLKPKKVAEEKASQAPELPALRRLESLQKEIENLREERLCKICLEKEASIVFLPCGHLCSCSNCASALKNCAVCRTAIQGMVRTFMV